MAEFRAGLWKKVGKSGIKFCSGKIKIGTQDYQIVLFNNDKKNDKAPDFNLILRTEEVKQEQVKQEQVKDNVDPFKTFGEMIENEDIPF